jgi:succinate dehydrogenase / fumarate reductase flavoprotein subunit
VIGQPVGNVPDGDLAEKWTQHQFDMKLVAPNNRRKFEIIIVGSGLAGASAAATLGEQGYNVKVFTYHDSPRRAHSIAAQGGINAAKNYKGDGDSVQRLFYDTIKGGDFRSREGNVHRLAELSVDIIDQMVAQGVPFAREYGGLLDNRSFGGAQVSRTFYARGQTGQQLLLGAYQQMMKQVHLGTVELHTRSEMLDLVVKDDRACGVVVRDLVTGAVTRHSAHAVILCTGGYGNVYFLSTNAMYSNASATWRAHRRGALFANPCFTQIHPTCIPASDDFQSKLTLMSESLRNDGRIWVPKNPDDTRSPDQIPEAERDYFLERKYPSFGNLVPRDVASRNAKTMVDEGKGVGPLKNGVYLDFSEAIQRVGVDVIRERYDNLFQMYERITDEDPYKVPMRIYPAIHYTMGGLWVDYHLMSNVPGLFVLGDDPAFNAAQADVDDRVKRLLSVGGTQSVDHYHRELGKIMWDYCGMARNKTGLEKALSEIPALREQFWKDVRVLGDGPMNQSLERAGRVADFFELGELMVRDALEREESCGGHFREEHQTDDGEALRDDEHFAHVAAWEWGGDPSRPVRHKEELHFENVHLSQRSYK